MITEMSNDLIDLGSSIGGFFSNLSTNMSTWFSDLKNGIGGFFNNLGSTITNSFNDLIDTIIYFFVPTEEQKQAHLENEVAFQETIKSKIPFIPFFSEEIEKAFSYQDSTDFLHLEFPSWTFDLGIVEFSTPEIDFTSVRDAYEPYRIYIRGFLLLIVYGLAGVYIVKFILNYGVTDAVNTSVKGGKE